VVIPLAEVAAALARAWARGDDHASAVFGKKRISVRTYATCTEKTNVDADRG
jgi:hypothetical protein